MVIMINLNNNSSMAVWAAGLAHFVFADVFYDSRHHVLQITRADRLS